MDRISRCACGRRATLRGLCRACYERMAYRVKCGKTTWERLEAEGAVLPARRPSCPSYRRK